MNIWTEYKRSLLAMKKFSVIIILIHDLSFRNVISLFSASSKTYVILTGKLLKNYSSKI